MLCFRFASYLGVNWPASLRVALPKANVPHVADTDCADSGEAQSPKESSSSQADWLDGKFRLFGVVVKNAGGGGSGFASVGAYWLFDSVSGVAHGEPHGSSIVTSE